jgi:hypothetical protein
VLAAELGAARISTKDLILATNPTAARERRALQRLGRDLDAATGGAWISNACVLRAQDDPAPYLIVDAVRTEEQVKELRRHFSTVHVHVTASSDVVEERYKRKRREGSLVELASYLEVEADETEAATEALAESADLVIDTSASSCRDNTRRVTTHLVEDQGPARPRSSRRTRR